MLNVGEFPWSWDRTKLSKEKEKFVVACLRSPQQVAHGHFTSWSCSDDKEIYQKVCCMCKILVLRVKPIAFLTFSLSSRSWLLKLPEF